ncbi:hypothetical protein Vadar_029148 [Vaccinium darrowii]|uniref:Uncharacterized protein n=1 Tax=Vaccinium darrowii TaxID=229202 RepID=A0ACB7Y9W8_9ERIC|nr:hypothetical protein Vadar_029148 [Vaccinium darrowii]
MYDSFQEFGLICFDGYKHCEMQCRDDNIKARTTAFQELNMVLRSVCEIHELPLAMTWVPCSACNDLLRGQLLSEGVEFCDHRNIHLTDFLQVSKCSHLRKGGIFEKALSSPYMLYCADITQISLTEHPLVPYARMCNFSGWFTLCLQSSYTENEVYVLEFFLPTSSMDDESILTTLSLILGTMEANFKTFKLASGQQLGEVLSAEVMDFRNGQKLHFVQMIQAPRLSRSPELLKDRGLMLQLTSLEEGKRKKQRKHKGGGVRIEVSLDDILKCAKMKRKGAAEKLKVSTSTFKRACREYASRLSVSSWPTTSFGSLSPTPKYLALSIRGVRVGGVEIPDNKRLEFSLQYIHGIGRTTAHQILCDLNMENKFTKDLSEHEKISLREEVSKYLIEHQLRRSNELEIKRLKEIQCYRGIRHIQGLPCRGQRTH